MADLEKITKKRLGELLIAEGIVSQDQVAEALKMQERTGDMLGEALVKAGYTTETEIAKILCTQFAKPYVKASKYDIARDVLSLIPPRLLIEQNFIPVDRFGNILVIAMGGLLDAQTIAQVQKLTSCDVEIYISTTSDVRQTLRAFFPDHFDPITMQPKFDATAAFTQPVKTTTGGGDPGEPTETKALQQLSGLAEEESDWEALFEEAEQNVLRELKDKKPQPPRPGR
jgi:hypothetical protein